MLGDTPGKDWRELRANGTAAAFRDRFTDRLVLGSPRTGEFILSTVANLAKSRAREDADGQLLIEAGCEEWVAALSSAALSSAALSSAAAISCSPPLFCQRHSLATATIALPPFTVPATFELDRHRFIFELGAGEPLVWAQFLDL
jgi:hypothetical protein